MRLSDFERLYVQHFAGVYRFLLSLSRDASLAEELTQETFYRAMKGWRQYRGDCSAGSWLCQIAKNAYFNHRRRARGAPVAAETPDAPDPLHSLLAREERARLHRALHRLEEPYREVFTLRVFAGLGVAEIARLFARSENWTRVTYYRARAKLMRLIEEEDADA